MKIFVSWSKDPSNRVAIEVKHLIEMTLPGTTVWVSELDIGKGKRWSAEIAKELEKTNIGIICCLLNNMAEPWLHFEAGALSKSIADSMVHPLCFGVEPGDLPGTLAQFQATRFEKADVSRLLHEINSQCERKALPAELDARFNRLWPTFEREVTAAIGEPPQEEAAATKSGNEPPPADTLSDEELELMKHIAEAGGRGVAVGVLSAWTGWSEIRTRHYLNKLESKDYVDATYNLAKPAVYRLSDKGMGFAVEKNWA